MKKINIKGMDFEYDSKNVRIKKSYQIKDKEYMELILAEFKSKTDYDSKRTIKSWLKEWKAHNRLNRLGIFKTHTIDCDLEENERLHRLLIYQILGM